MTSMRSVALAVLLAGLVVGCQTSGKRISPTQPQQIYTPAKAATKPATTNMNTTPSRQPLVNGTETRPPATAPVMQMTPGVSQTPIGAPTIPHTAPAPVMPVSSGAGYLPPMPPSMPGETGAPVAPAPSPIAAPAGLIRE